MKVPAVFDFAFGVRACVAAEKQWVNVLGIWGGESNLGDAAGPVLVGVLSGTIGIRRSFSLLAGSTLVAALFVDLLFSDRVYRWDAWSGAENWSAVD